MRVARARFPDGEDYLARIDAETATPLMRDATQTGLDILRLALDSGFDIEEAPPVAHPTSLDEVQLLAPLRAPQKIVGIGLNYTDHADESGLKVPSAPIAFMKGPNSIVGPGEPIRYSKEDTTEVDYEAELALVIGRRARRVSEADAMRYVFGYTICNDVSARDAQFGDGQWVRGKSFDTFCPVGPWIVTADTLTDPQSLSISCTVNGRTVQDSSTAQMIFSCAQIVAYLSRSMTLEAGDIIATGTPSGVGFARRPQVWLSDGDVVRVMIESIGTLTNPVQVT